MKRGEKLKVFVKMNDRYYLLFKIIQMGKNGIVDLKITNTFDHTAFIEGSNLQNQNCLTTEILKKSRPTKHSEISYHSDGTFLRKITESPKSEYLNPYGEGKRWTATKMIEDFQPILNIEIRRMEIYNKSTKTLKAKKSEKIYVCKNDELFERTGSYLLLLYIRHKNIPLNKYTNKQGYSDVIVKLTKELDLCLSIQRHNYPSTEPYYSKEYKSMVTPYLVNSINFCDNRRSKNEIMKKFKSTIFSPKLELFLNKLSEGNFFHFSEEKLLLIDEIDILYTSHEGKMPVDKATFIKIALDYLGPNLSLFNSQPSSMKQYLFQVWNNELKIQISIL